MFKKINVAVLLFFLFVQSFIMPISASAASFDSVSLGAAIAAAQAGDDGEDGTKNNAAQPATASTATEQLINLSFDKLVHNGDEVYDQDDADDLEPKAGDKVELHYKFVTKEMLPGDKFVFQLPQQLLLYDEEALSGEIRIPDTKDGEQYFTYATNKETREVTITAKQYISEEGMEGGIYFTAAFGNFNGQSLEQTLVVPQPGKEDFKLNFEFAPLVEDAPIIKDGTLRITESGEQYIDWQVIFNLDNNRLGKSIKFEDTIGGEEPVDNGQVLVEKSVNVSLVKTIATLQSIQPDPEAAPIVLLTNGEGVTFDDQTFSFEINSEDAAFDFYNERIAVLVTYSTELTKEPDSETEIFENVATAESGSNDWEIEASLPITYGTPLSKNFVSGDKYTANWKIEFNKLGKTITEGTTITDTVSNQHKILHDTIKVTKYVRENGEWKAAGELQDGSGYTFTELTDNTFTIDLLELGNYAVEIEYQTTSAEEFITSGGVVKNEVTTSLTNDEGTPYTAEASFSYAEEIGVKQIRSIDYVNRVIEWYVSFTSEGKEVTNFKLEDQLPNGLTLKPYDGNADFKMLKGTASDINLTHVNGNITASVAGPKTVDVAFTYQTTYDEIPVVDGKFAGYSNTANFTWDGKTSTGNTLPETAVFTPKGSHITNGEKSGTYNYKTRTFHWTAGVNLDRKNIADITDTLGTGHKLVADSVKVYNATIGTDGSVTKREATDDFTITKTDTSFTLTPKSATSKPYYIEYETKDADHMMGQTDGSGLYENTIAVNGVKTEASVTIDRPNELVTKTSKQNKDYSTVSWTVDINKSGSLLTDAVLTDTLSAGNDVEHYILSETIRIQEIQFTETDFKVSTLSSSKKTVKEAIELGWLKADPNIADKAKTFTFAFGDLSDLETPQAFRITYDTYYDGPHNEAGSFGNKAVITSGDQELPVGKESSQITEAEGSYQHNDSGAYADFKRVDVSITKLGVNNDTGDKPLPLKDVTFELYNQKQTVKLQTVTTDADGKATFKNVGYGTYTIKEVQTVEGYKGISDITLKLSSESEVSTKVSSDKANVAINETNELTIKNNEIMNSVEMTKTFEGVAADADDDLLKQVKFALFKQDGTRVTTTKTAKYENGVRTLVEETSADLTFTPDANGKVYVPYLDSDTYYFQEVETALGYQLDNTKFEGTIYNNSVKKVNTKTSPVNKPLKVTVTNVEGDPDDDTSPTNTDPKIKGSTFEVYAVTENVCKGPGEAFTPTQGQTPVKIDGVDVFTTDENGQLTIDFSKIDKAETATKYVIVQKHVAGEGSGDEYKEVYFVDRPLTVVQCIDFTKPDQPTNPIFENERLTDKVTIEVVKTDVDTKQPIEGAIFTLTAKAPHESVGSFVGKTNAEGKVTKWFKGTEYPADDSTGDVVPPRAVYTISETVYPVGYEKLEVTNGTEINFTKAATENVTVTTTNETIKRDINVFDTCILGERVYEIHTADGQQALQKDGTLKATVAYADSKDSEDVVRFVIPAGKTFDEAVNKGDFVIPAGSYEIVQVYTDKEVCKQDPRPFTVTPNDPTPTNEKFGDNVAIIQFKTCGDGELAPSYVFEKNGQQYTATLDENGQAIVKMPASASDTDYYTVKVGEKTLQVIVPELSGDVQPITIYTGDCYSEVEVELQVIEGGGCLEDGAEVTVTLQDAQGNAIQTLTANGQTYAVYNNEVIIDNQLFNVELTEGTTTVTVNGTSYTVGELAPKTITKGTEPTTALFDNLMPGDYKVVVTGGDCLSAPPTVTVPPGETTKVPLVPGESGNLNVPIQFIGGLGCLTDSSVTVSLRSNGEPVQQITIDGTTYGVLNGQVIVDGKFYSAAVDGTFTIGNNPYIPALYEQTMTKSGFANVEANFTNLMPGKYDVIVSAVECIVPETPANPEEPTTPPSVNVPPGETPTVVPFEEKPKQPGTLEAKVEFIGGAGCTENGDVQLQLFTSTNEAVNYIELNGVKYGVINNEVIIDNKPYKIVEDNVTIDGQTTAVEVKPYIVTVTKTGVNEATATFTNLVPGKYVVKVIDNECITTDEPTVDVPPGVQTPPTVEFDEKPKQPGSIEVPVKFAGGQGCTENGDVTVTLKDVNGNDVQAVTIDGKQYGILDDQVIVDGAVYNVVKTENTATFTNVATGEQLVKDGQPVTSDVAVYTKTVTKTGANTATAVFENLVPGNYTVIVTNNDCIVPENPANPEEPTTPPSVNVPPGETSKVPFEEKPTTPGNVEVTVEFIKGVSCLEDGAAVTATLQHKGETVKAITVGGTTYGILNNEVIVDGQVYDVSGGKVTIAGQSYDAADYTITITEQAPTAQFTNLVPGEYTVKMSNNDCIVPENPANPEEPTTPPSVNVPPGETSKVPFKETLPTCDKEVEVPVTPGATITVNDQLYTDEDGDGKINVPTTDLTGNTSVKDEEGNEIGTIVVNEEECPTFESTRPLACTVFTLEVKVDRNLVPVTTPVKLVSTTNPTVFVVGTATENGIVTYNDPFTLVPGEYNVVINDVVYGQVAVEYGVEPCEAKIFDGKTPEELPETPEPTPTTCSEEFVKVPNVPETATTVTINGEEVPVNEIPMGTPPGKYPVNDKDGNKIGEIEIVEPTEPNPCEAEFEPVPTPEPPTTCSEEFVKVPNVPETATTVTINGEEVRVSEIPMGTPPGKYPVNDKDGNKIGEIEIVEPTEPNPCEAEFKPTPQPEPTPEPSCNKDVTVPVTPGVAIVVNGKTYDDNDGDGKVTVTGEALTPGEEYAIETTTGEKVGTVTIDEDDCTTVVIIYTTCMAGTFTAPELAGQTITLTNAQGQTTSVKVNENGEATVPFINGTFTVTNAAGETLGEIVMKDCEGEFTFTVTAPACTAATISLPGYAAGTAVSATNGSETVQLTVAEDLTVTVPFTEGEVTLTVDGQTIGAVTLVDCEGEFLPTIHACDIVEATLEQYVGQTVTLTFGDVTVDVTVGEDGVVTIPVGDEFKGANKDGATIEVSVEGEKVADITVENCKVSVHNVTPVTPGEPTQPVVPIVPIDPPSIENPDKPGNTENPDEPGNTENPDEPSNPVTPTYPVEIHPEASGCTYIATIDYVVVNEAGEEVAKSSGSSDDVQKLKLPVGKYEVKSKGKVIHMFEVTASDTPTVVNVTFECSKFVLTITADKNFGNQTPPKLSIVPIIDGFPKCHEVKETVQLQSATDVVAIDISSFDPGKYAVVNAEDCKQIEQFVVPADVTEDTPPIVVEVPKADPTPTPTPTPSVPSQPAMPSVPAGNFAVEFNAACFNDETVAYDIYYMSGMLIKTVKPDSKGNIQFTIPAGTYKVVKQGEPTSTFELITVTGSKAIESFTFVDDSECKEETIVNPPLPPATPEKGTEIVEFTENPACEANQTYGIYTKDGQLKQYVKTNDQGVAIAFLATGEYVLKDANNNVLETFTVSKDISNKVSITSLCIDVPSSGAGDNPGGNVPVLPPISTPGDKPGTTDTPGTTETPTTPGVTDTPGTSDTSGTTDTPGTSGTPNPSGTPGTSSTTGTPGTSNTTSTGGNNYTNNSSVKPSTSTSSTNASGNKATSNTTTTKPSSTLPQTNVDSSSNYLQLLGLVVIGLAAFVFIRRRQLNK